MEVEIEQDTLLRGDAEGGTEGASATVVRANERMGEDEFGQDPEVNHRRLDHRDGQPIDHRREDRLSVDLEGHDALADRETGQVGDFRDHRLKLDQTGVLIGDAHDIGHRTETS